MKPFLLSLMAVIALGMPVPAAAQPAVRVITATEATSDCIGDPRTPLCAAETFLACFVRMDQSLCRRVEVTMLTKENIHEGFEGRYSYEPGFADIEFWKQSTFIEPVRSFKPEWKHYGIVVKPTASGWGVADWAGEDGD